jgi:hypothetical protein
MKLNFLPQRQFAYTCDDTLEDYTCIDCDDTVEHARIGAGAVVHEDAYADIIADPSNDTVWQTAIAAGKVIIMPKLRGTFDGGTPKIVDGYGRQKNRTTGSDFSASVEDPTYKANWAFYNSLVGKTTWHFAYVTESQCHISGVPVNFAPKNPITNNVDDAVVWITDITWFEAFTPAPFDTPEEIFVCTAQ